MISGGYANVEEHASRERARERIGGRWWVGIGREGRRRGGAEATEW